MNLRPLGYEPNELPNCSTLRYQIGRRGGDRTRSLTIISRVRQPVAPLSYIGTPNGVRTHDVALKGLWLNHLPMGAYQEVISFFISYYIYIIAYFFGFVHNFSCYNQKYFFIWGGLQESNLLTSGHSRLPKPSGSNHHIGGS